MIITTHAFARAGLVGNPSDGYFGKTVSFSIRNFRATVRLWESPTFEILPNDSDVVRFDSMKHFLREQKLMGYYGGMRLVRAAVARFYRYCEEQSLPLKPGNFTISYESTIPRLVGMSGSSAIVIATLRALCAYHGVELPKHYFPTVALQVETQELGIAAGLQDRVAQVYENLVYMDFERSQVEGKGYGHYEYIKPAGRLPVYVAYDPQRAEISGVPHANLRARWESGEKKVVDAMQTFAGYAASARKAIETGDWDTLHKVCDQNFDLRLTIMDVAPENKRMVETARSVGASAKFAGSGGAIVGTYRDGHQYQKLSDKLATIGCTTLRPMIFED
ncbi:MAG: mevalonate kinase [Phycisphaerae bacterium]